MEPGKVDGLKNILSSVFSVQTGLSNDAAEAMFLRAVAADPLLIAEIRIAFDQKDTNWRELLFNENYEVYETDTNEDARDFARQLLLKPLANAHR